MTWFAVHLLEELLVSLAQLVSLPETGEVSLLVRLQILPVINLSLLCSDLSHKLEFRQLHMPFPARVPLHKQ